MSTYFPAIDFTSATDAAVNSEGRQPLVTADVLRTGLKGRQCVSLPTAGLSGLSVFAWVRGADAPRY
jgi:hypothetical protein